MWIARDFLDWDEDVDGPFPCDYDDTDVGGV